MKNKKIVLAYSGGLDTSVILKWLIDQGYEVICYLADVGQHEDFIATSHKAKAIGASTVTCVDLKSQFLQEYIFPALAAHAVYEGTYLLGTALARPLIAKGLIEEAKKQGATLIAHGATGKGNDQIRFELAIRKLMPEVKIIAPWRDPQFLSQFEGRSDLIAYANRHGIPISAKKPYSMDANLMHISYEGGLLEDPALPANPNMFQWTTSPLEAPDKVTPITLYFSKGWPIRLKVADKTIEEPLSLFEHLNELAAKNGIGRIDIVENRTIGLKSRGVYETPGGTLLLKAHQALETLILNREVFQIKEFFSLKLAQLIYDGMWFSSECQWLLKGIQETQQNIEGQVDLALYKGNAWIEGRSSLKSRYSKSLASMESHRGFNAQDTSGYLNIQALRF